MVLISLKMQNYKKYEDFYLEFSEGLTGIVGRNGSGKSTIFSAIIFALYGDMRGEKENIRFARADKNAAVNVELIFEIEQNSYKIVRQMRGKNLIAKAYLYDDKENLLSESSKSVTAEISRLTGMNKEAFVHTIFASQKELTALSVLKSDERKRIIRKLLGLEKIDKIEKEIKLKIRDLNKEIETIGGLLLKDEEVNNIKNQKNLKQKKIDNLKKEVDKIESEFQKRSDELKDTDKRLKTLQKQKDQYVSLKNRLSLVQKSLQNEKANLKKRSDYLHDLMENKKIYEKEKFIINEYKELETKILDFQKQKEIRLKREGLQKHLTLLQKQLKEVKSEIDELKEKIKKRDSLLKEEKNYREDLNDCEKSLNDIRVKESLIKEETAGFVKLVKESESKIKNIQKLGKNSNCPTCTRALLDEYDNVINSLRKSINELKQKEIEKREKELKRILLLEKEKIDKKDKIMQKLKELGEELSVLSVLQKRYEKRDEEFTRIKSEILQKKEELNTLKDLNYEKEAYDKAINQKKSLEKRYKELLGIKKIIEQIPSIKEEIDNYKNEISKYKVQTSKFESKIKTHIYNVSEHEKTELKYKEILSQRDEISKEMSLKKVFLQEIKGEILTLNSKLKRDEEQKNIFNQKIVDRNDFKKLKLFLNEFKNKINSQISPKIGLYASQMYANITKGRYQHIEVNEEFDFFIYDDGVKYPLERFSGGEIDLANLVLRIAISRTLSELAGKGGVGFLAFDEVFGSQDEERRFEIMEAFHTIKEQYRQIFLISHEKEVREMFEKTIQL